MKVSCTKAISRKHQNGRISTNELAAWLHLEPSRYKKLIEKRPDIAVKIVSEFKKAGEPHSVWWNK